ncbi:MAG: 4-hydroxythreonine-4-phosphate dehydrogenase PdxA [Bacteroidales bacterium]|jgi:4-hydroxythreonine-4-phosphate dehydrogenase|nr:4-hydroxythreonine-4-phosphate dehydrogenase PdxA [Bacteroidales bacterium]
MSKIKIGITQGDINGISYEIIIKNFSEPKNLSNIIPIIYGSSKVFSVHKKNTNLNVNSMIINSVEEAKNSNLHIINCNSEEIKVEIGRSTDVAGLASFQALEKSVSDLKDNKLNIIITNPVDVHNINEAGFDFISHSNYFTSKFKVENYLEILVKDNLRIAIVCDSTSVSDLHLDLSSEIILNKIELLNKTLKKDFLLDRPKIAVLGLNPFNKNLNVDEKTVNIVNAIEMANAKNIFVFGVYNAEDFFGNFEYNKFDAVLAMYHEQAYIPFKLLEREEGIKYTAGLPFLHVSPINEVSFDNAGKNLASEISFRHAIEFALDVLKNREYQDEIEKNKLKIGAFAEDIKSINQIDE